MKIYLDNVICSGIARGDLAPPDEMKATLALVSAGRRGDLHLLTSVESWREQERTIDAKTRATLGANREAVERVPEDHAVLGFATTQDQWGGFVANPLVTDIVDSPLFKALQGVGLADADARHVMYAVHNGCCWFVTLDTRDILPKRLQIETVCPRLRVVIPTQLAAELNLEL